MLLPPLPVQPDTQQAYHSLAAILDAIDALVYVTDMDTREIIFINQYGKNIWGDIVGKLCWKSLQSGQTGPCDFCTNDKLLDENGVPTGVLVWEFQNTVDGRWYQCRDQAIPWINGKMVRLEIATDITDLKNNEHELKTAKQAAEDLARIDELTGIKNRRALFDELRILFNLAKRYGSGLIVAMLDVDHFKKVNDQFGHASGDKVLVELCNMIQQNIREVDLFGRYGGEEFVLVLPGVDISQAHNTLERLRKLIENFRFTGFDPSFGITCSIGLATQHEEYQDIDVFLADADNALYTAKTQGRNRTVVYQHPLYHSAAQPSDA